MSLVTNVILITALDDGGPHSPNAQTLSDYLAAEYDGDSLARVDACFHGGRIVENEVYLGAYNWLDREELLKRFRTIPWQYPDMAQLGVRSQDDEQFEFIKAPEWEPKK